MSSLILLSLAIACNPPEGKANETIWTNLQPLDDGGFGAGFGVIYTASEEARAYDNELSVNLGTIVRDNEAVNMEMLVIGTLEDSWGATATSEYPDVDIQIEADLEACESDNMVVLDDGSCEAQYVVAVGGEASYAIIMGFEFRSQAPEGAPEDEVVVSVYAEEGQAEE